MATRHSKLSVWMCVVNNHMKRKVTALLYIRFDFHMRGKVAAHTFLGHDMTSLSYCFIMVASFLARETQCDRFKVCVVTDFSQSITSAKLTWQFVIIFELSLQRAI